MGPVESWLSPMLGDHDAVVVVGGDGLVHAVAPACAAAAIPLLHDPAGTENLFAREITGSARPQAPEEVAERLLGRAIRRVDLGRLELTTQEGTTASDVLLVMASIGFDARVVAEVDAARTGGISKWSYAWPILQAVGRWRAPFLSVEIDGETLCQETPGTLIIANSCQYAGRLDPALHATVDDGLLDVVLLPGKTAVGLARWTALAWLRGAHLGGGKVRYRMGREIVVSIDPSSELQVDGDPQRTAGRIVGLRARIEPAALPVL